MKDGVSRVATGSAPVRIDFFGGWTDLPLFTKLVPGRVLSTSITLYTYASVSLSLGPTATVNMYGYSVEVLDNEAGIHMYSEDLDIREDARSIVEIEYNGTLDLVKAACKRLAIETDPGIEIRTRSEAPPGSGLGTSASLGVAVIGALTRFFECPPVELGAIADLAYRLEAEELGLLTGTQDQYAAAWGDLALWKCLGEEVSYHPVRLGTELRSELEARCVLVYTGVSRLSSDIHRHVRSAFATGANHEAIKGLAELPERAVELLFAGDLDEFGILLARNWELQKALHESVTNTQIDHIFDTAFLNGAIGGKACGAGGGGCLLFFAEKNRGHLLRKKLADMGLEILHFRIDTHGLNTWIWT